ncbi:ABC transporter ATP-binding protein [Gordonia paraffinivorans]|uniref:ABC transporter ATP-binding protein n=1 Tax=Gordonia paraffinivorans TaxID=175628 RepID=UPI001444C0E6|nr:ABC transporter ATP-binding protein [Gordonia paraffinivorans]
MSAVLSVRDLCVVRRSRGRTPRRVLDAICFDVEPGSVVGFVGPNGSGKSTLLSAIAAGRTVTRGSIRCRDVELAGARPHVRARHVAFVPQQARLAFGLTVREIVGLGARVNETSERADRIVDSALRQAGCAHLAERPGTALSGGECQLVHIARALAQSAPVLVMDEPVSALDLAHQTEVLALARSHAAAGPATATILSIHDLGLAARFCDRLILMETGRIAAVGTPVQVLTPERIEQVYGVRVRTDHDPVTGSLRVTAFPHAAAVLDRRAGDKPLLPATLVTRATPGTLQKGRR